MTVDRTDLLFWEMDPTQPARAPMQYEQLVRWAIQEWQQRYPEQPYEVVWASDDCGSHLARKRVKAGRKLKDKTQYQGYTELQCPWIVPISAISSTERSTELTDYVGAFIFSFTHENHAFDVLFASAHYSEWVHHYTVSIALVPPAHLHAW